MLTVSPVLWGVAIYKVFVHFQGKSIRLGVLIVSVIFFGMSVMLDYLFFGHFRNAMEELYHPTTFYGYAFVLFLPAMIYLTFRRKIEASRRDLIKKDFWFVIVFGQLCFLSLLFVILLE